MKLYLSFFITLSVLVLSCGENQKTNSDRPEAPDVSQPSENINHAETESEEKSVSDEEKIYAIILKLPEVKERANYIEKKSNGSRHLKIWINAQPNLADKNYWVKVGEDNGTNLVSHFNFLVDEKTFEISYFDTEKDTIITLNTWRKMNKQGL